MKTLQRWRQSGKIPETAWKQQNQRVISYLPEWLKEKTGRDIDLPENTRRRLLYGRLPTEHTGSGLEAAKKRKRFRGAPGELGREELEKEAERLRGERRELYWMSPKQMAGRRARSCWNLAKDRREGRVPKWAYVAKNARVFLYHAAYLCKSPLARIQCISRGIEDALRIGELEEAKRGFAALGGLRRALIASRPEPQIVEYAKGVLRGLVLMRRVIVASLRSRIRDSTPE